jgi:hypothetical protein
MEVKLRDDDHDDDDSHRIKLRNDEQRVSSNNVTERRARRWRTLFFQRGVLVAAGDDDEGTIHYRLQTASFRYHPYHPSDDGYLSQVALDLGWRLTGIISNLLYRISSTRYQSSYTEDEQDPLSFFDDFWSDDFFHFFRLGFRLRIWGS